jgi:hypothetical protein
MAGLKVYDENGEVIFDDTMRLLKFKGVVTVPAGGRWNWNLNGGQGGYEFAYFQIPLKRGELAFVYFVDHLVHFESGDSFAFELNEETGLVSYCSTRPITFAYGAW